MDQARVLAKVNFGFGKAAQYLGAAFTQYRPSGPNNPIADANAVGTLLAAFDPDPAFSFKQPSSYGKPIYFGLFDPTNVQVGDYLVNPDPGQGTYFLAGFEPIKPPLCVVCNRVLTFSRPGMAPPGRNAYGGPVPADYTPMAAGWPASVLKGTKGDKGDPGAGLPGDTRQAWVQVLLPKPPGVELLPGDVIMDDQPAPFRYTLSSVELTELGYRIEAATALM